MRIFAPAKLNLFLEVLDKRPDGYHEIETFMAPVNLYDSLFITPSSDEEIRFSYGWANGFLASGNSPEHSGGSAIGEAIPLGRDNLVVRALEMLRERARIRQGATAYLLKRIPSSAGLGGASSDAAAALVLGCKIWNVNWTTEQILPLAAELGSDVPFFLLGEAAICRGRGERMERVADIPSRAVVVVKPPVGLSTADVYRNCRPATNPLSARECLESWRTGKAKPRLGMFNRLQEAAKHLCPWMGRLEQEFKCFEGVAHQMSGSGSSYFGVCHNMKHALSVAARLRARRLGSVFCVSTGKFTPGREFRQDYA